MQILCGSPFKRFKKIISFIRVYLDLRIYPLRTKRTELISPKILSFQKIEELILFIRVYLDFRIYLLRTKGTELISPKILTVCSNPR